MTAETKRLHNADVVPYTNGGTARPAGDVVQVPDGRAGVIGNQGLDANEEGAATCEGVYEINAASALVAAAGVTVGWDDTNKEVVASASGDFDIGSLHEAKADGETTVKVVLNV